MKPHSLYSNLLLFDLFDREKSIVHFTTTRTGGVSDGAFSSFNMGNFSDDNPLSISENREILARMFYMDASRFIIPHQTHSARVLTIDKNFLSLDHAVAIETLYGVDATITVEKDIFLCVTTADCVPVILYDRRNEVIAAIHAGWRGTAERITEKTVMEMERQFGSSPGDILAGIGPSIDASNYEVGNEVANRFREQGFDLSDATLFPRKNPASKFHIDLKEINRRELVRLGVPGNSIEKSALCTFERENLFFSARRQTVHSGRMLTGIMMKR
ncbi:MAG: peptidoglycan editing factor PgeF [Proteiniphilum sp.]|jgi:YfiH family protein|nr:peptidoglycan editing factor PgeF [Proteiniphilum sp.]